MQLRTRVDGGGTPRPAEWGIDSEYGRLRDLLIGPIDNYHWTPGNAVSQRSERLGLAFDSDVVRAQYQEMIAAYEEAGVNVYQIPAEAGLPYQVYARDSSVMTPWGAIIMQMEKPYRRGEYAAVLRFYLEHGIPIYDIVSAGNVEGVRGVENSSVVGSHHDENSTGAGDFLWLPFNATALAMGATIGLTLGGLMIAVALRIRLSKRRRCRELGRLDVASDPVVFG